MANKLQILSSGESFDLFDGEAERFYITYQIHDLSNLQTRNGDFSRRVSLPLTAKNKGILGAALPTISRFDSVAVDTIPCEILVNDMPALSNAYFVIDTQQDNSVTIQIFGGISKFYSNLPDTSIRTLTFSTIDWTNTGITALSNATTGVVTADAQWITNQSIVNIGQGFAFFPEMNEAGFFVYLKAILEKIFEGFTDLTFNITALDAQFSKYAVACALPLIHNQYTNSETITTTINPQDYFPEISQRDFVREIFKIQNIVAVEANNVVTLKYFKALETATSKNLVLNTDKSKTINNTFKTYSQTNFLKYSEDEIIESTGFNSSFTVNSETLPLSGTIIQSKFFPSDVGDITNNNGRYVMPYWTFERLSLKTSFHPTQSTVNFTTNDPSDLKVGDMIEVSINGPRRVVTLNGAGDAGTVDRNFTSSTVDQNLQVYRYSSENKDLRIVSMEDAIQWSYKINGETFASLATGVKKAIFIDALKWDDLKAEYYELLVDTMNKPFIVKAFINIPSLSLLALDLLAPVYVEDYNAYFYINKLEQWKLNTACRVELIQIPI